MVGRLNFFLLVPFWGHVNFRGGISLLSVQTTIYREPGKLMTLWTKPKSTKSTNNWTQLNKGNKLNNSTKLNKGNKSQIISEFWMFRIEKKTCLMNQATRAAKRCPAPKFLGRWLRGTEYLTSDGNKTHQWHWIFWMVDRDVYSGYS